MNCILTGSAMIFPLLSYPYVSRILQPEGMGKVAFANSVVAYFAMGAMMGIPTYGIRVNPVSGVIKASTESTHNIIQPVN